MRDAEYRALFPRASKSFAAANAATLMRPADKSDSCAIAGGKKRGFMNATEGEFALRLEGMKREGEILRYEYEGITLRWADMRYTPDFIVFHVAYVSLIEVKGGHIWDRDIVRYKGARAYWPEFTFELWQRKGGQWKRLF